LLLRLGLPWVRTLTPRFFAFAQLRGFLLKKGEGNAALMDIASSLRRRPRRAGKPFYTLGVIDQNSSLTDVAFAVCTAISVDLAERVGLAVDMYTNHARRCPQKRSPHGGGGRQSWACFARAQNSGNCSAGSALRSRVRSRTRALSAVHCRARSARSYRARSAAACRRCPGPNARVPCERNGDSV
jgi:hypothetical protein